MGQSWADIAAAIINAADQNAGLVVTGRWGLHREPESLIGSNTQSLARLSSASVLIVPPKIVETSLSKVVK